MLFGRIDFKTLPLSPSSFPSPGVGVSTIAASTPSLLMSELWCLVRWVPVGGQGAFFFSHTRHQRTSTSVTSVLAYCDSAVLKSPISQLPRQKELLRTMRVDQGPHPLEMTVSTWSHSILGVTFIQGNKSLRGKRRCFV